MATLLAQMEDLQRGQRIKAQREALHMTQPAVAEAMGVTVRAYQKYEAGGGMRWPNAEKLADVLRFDSAAEMLGKPRVPPAVRYIPPAGGLARVEAMLTLVLQRLGVQGPELVEALREAALGLEQAAVEAEEILAAKDRRALPSGDEPQ